MLKGHAARLFVLLACSAGCTSSSDDADASAPEDAGASDASDLDAAADADGDADAEADADTGVDEVDPTILTNFSFDAAKHVEVDEQGVLQPLEDADQVDYFEFEAEAGEVYVITTNRGRFTPDNVLGLYSPERELLAENDVGSVWPFDEVDARLVVRTQESGTYFVVVEDRVIPAEVFEFEDIPTFFYRVTVKHVVHDSPGFAWEADQDDDTASVAFTQDEASGVAYVTLIGELQPGQTDRFELQGSAAHALIGHVLPAGPAGNGSTLSSGVVQVRDASDHLVAEIDRALGVEEIHPPVEAATYTLSVGPGSSLGDNPFYAIDLVLLLDNPVEEASDNDTLETAQPLPLPGGFRRRGTILAEVPAADIDYFELEAMAGDMLQVTCEGHSAGSGVSELRAEIRDAADEVLGEATETIDHGLLLAGVQAAEAGSYYLRLSSETPDDSEAASAWVRCAVIADL